MSDLGDRRNLLDALAELGGKLTAEEDVVFQGQKIVLPENMDIGGAVAFLQEKKLEDDNVMNFTRTFRYRPWDGARATMHALRRAFGMVSQRGGLYRTGETGQAELRTIPVSVDETEQIPWGGLGVAHLAGCTLTLGAVSDPDVGQLFMITATGPRRYRHHIEGIFRLIEEELSTNSMYRGKAFDGQEVPQFLDLSGVDASKVVYTAEVLDRLATDIWSLIRFPDQMREMGLPLKRAVLLEGPYGTGKTLAAYLTAQIAQEHGWTFIYGRPGRDELGDLMATARLYQPAVVFFEDVDTVASADGVDDVSRMLDILDGMQSKGTEIICILTTNHIGRLHKGMVRPGRLDAVIHIGALDPPAVERLIRSLVPDQLLTGSVDWAAVGAAMEGFMPAFCKEAIDRAMRWNLSRHEGKASPLETEDFVVAADTLRPQLELMGRANEHGGVDGVGAAISRTVRNSIDGTLLV
ncbi:MAG TPA: ATP-binding protein, partial [Acidimicrobiia bacterium]|nr:ATP-binding protein [Acidimicrobiia bacterium]